MVQNRVVNIRQLVAQVLIVVLAPVVQEVQAVNLVLIVVLVLMENILLPVLQDGIVVLVL